MTTETHPWLDLWKAAENDCRMAEDDWRDAMRLHGPESREESEARLEMRRKQDLARQYFKGLMRDLRKAATHLRSAPPPAITPWRTKPTHKMKVLQQARRTASPGSQPRTTFRPLA